MSRKQTPQPFKEITGNGSIDSTGDPLKQEHPNQCFGASASTQPAATAQLGRQTATVLPTGFPDSSTSQPQKPLPLRHKPLPSSWKRMGSFHNASPSMGHSSSSRHQHIPPRGHRGCTGDRVAGRAQRAGWRDKMLGTDCVTTRGAVSSSNTPWGTACSRDHSTNSFITQHVFFYKTKKKKETKALFLL